MAKNSQVLIWLIVPALDDPEENSSAGGNILMIAGNPLGINFHSFPPYTLPAVGYLLVGSQYSH